MTACPLVVGGDRAALQAALAEGACVVLVATDPAALADAVCALRAHGQGQVAGFLGDPADPVVMRLARDMGEELFARHAALPPVADD